MPGQPMKRAAHAVLDELTDEERAEHIFGRIEAGVSLSEVAQDLDIKRRFLVDWLESETNFHAYARSRARSATAMVEETVAIADHVDPEAAAIAKARLRIVTRQWLAKAYDRSTFGDSGTTVNISLAAAHTSALRKVSAEDVEPLTIEASPNSDGMVSDETPAIPDKDGRREKPHAAHALPSVVPVHSDADSNAAL